MKLTVLDNDDADYPCCCELDPDCENEDGEAELQQYLRVMDVNDVTVDVNYACIKCSSVCSSCSNVTFRVITNPAGYYDLISWSASGGDPNSQVGGETFTTSWTAAGTKTVTASFGSSSDSNSVQIKGLDKLTFWDQPTRLKASAPVSWSATLQVVSQDANGSSSYTVLDSITYGFDIDSGQNVTKWKNDGGSCISVTTFNTYDSGGLGGVTIAAEYIGCAKYSLRWVQTITTTHPRGGCTSPYNDPCPPDDSLPYYWTDTELPSHISSYSCP